MANTGFKVLVGDDDPTMLRLLSRWLEKAGYVTQTAADGQEALEAIELDCPDFLITDWEMPRLTGFELCRRIREMPLPHYVYVIFLTGKTARTEMIAGLEIGANDFLCKPVTEGELLARMGSGSRVLELERRLSLMARTDSLTGLMTQRCFYECLAKEWHRTRRSQKPLSCAMIDLDFFKQINDVHGHPAGDTVLKAAADLLMESCRASDYVCRYGGEEFCILLPETNEPDAAFWADRVRKRLAAMKVQAGSRELHITGSFGVAQCRHDTQNSEELVDIADQALLYAKRSGRNRVECYTTLVETAEPKLNDLSQQDGIFHDVRAGEVMTPLVVCLHEDETIENAAEYFLQSGVASTPVLGPTGGLVGFLSEKDIMASMVSPDCWQKSLSEVMRSNVISYEEDTPIRIVYEFLCRVSMRQVVITKNGSPTGTISQNSLLRWYRGYVQQGGAASLANECSITNTASEPSPHIPDSAPAGHSGA